MKKEGKNCAKLNEGELQNISEILSLGVKTGRNSGFMTMTARKETRNYLS